MFWGIVVIGSTGQSLWFPVFFITRFLPGSFINVATIIHSDEALLATDVTRHTPVAELKRDKPCEYALPAAAN